MKNNMNQVKSIELSLEPNYISELTQVDGSFFCTISKRKKVDGSLYLIFRPTFEITLDFDSKSTLDKIKNYFSCGFIVKPSGGRFVSAFKVSSLDDTVNIIIPHFQKYPVLFDKLHAFRILVEICNHLLDIKKNKKLYPDKEVKLKYIKNLNLAISMNKSSLRSEKSIIELFSILGVIKSKIPSIISNQINSLTSKVTPEFISGYVDGDGSFYCVFNSNGQIKPYFNICFDDGSLEFIQETVKLFKISNPEIKNILEKIELGSISKHSSISRLVIGSLNQIENYIIPFFI